MPAPKIPAGGPRPIKTLERLISKAGLGSRTEARRWIADGRARVNGGVVRDPDFWVDLERDEVAFDGKPLKKSTPIYLLLYKPQGYLTTHSDPAGRPTVYDLLDGEERHLVSVGRLDLETSGLLILTNDTEFTERMTNPDFKVPKTYLVETSSPLSDEKLDQLRSGVDLRDGITRPAVVRRIGETAFEIVITEGRNRQVRRMVEAVGSEAVKLVRTAIGPVGIGELASGKRRELAVSEVDLLLSMSRQGSD